MKSLNKRIFMTEIGKMLWPENNGKVTHLTKGQMEALGIVHGTLADFIC